MCLVKEPILPLFSCLYLYIGDLNKTVVKEVEMEQQPLCVLLDKENQEQIQCADDNGVVWSKIGR